MTALERKWHIREYERALAELKRKQKWMEGKLRELKGQ